MGDSNRFKFDIFVQVGEIKKIQASKLITIGSSGNGDTHQLETFSCKSILKLSTYVFQPLVPVNSSIFIHGLVWLFHPKYCY